MEQPLVATSDTDWESFQNADPDWFIQAAGAVVRKYCGWHLFPNITETRGNLKMGSQGIIMVPTRHLTAVSQLIVLTGQAADADTGVAVDPGSYEWHEAGWIQRKGFAWWNDWYMGGYYYGTDPYYLPVDEPGWAQLTFSHGYTTLPEDIKQVVFELAQSSMSMTSGNIKMISAPNEFKLQTSQNFGMTLNPEQMGRLGNYRIGMVG